LRIWTQQTARQHTYVSRMIWAETVSARIRLPTSSRIICVTGTRKLKSDHRATAVRTVLWASLQKLINVWSNYCISSSIDCNNGTLQLHYSGLALAWCAADFASSALLWCPLPLGAFARDRSWHPWCHFSNDRSKQLGTLTGRRTEKAL